MKLKKAQEILGYAVLMVIVVAALLSMMGYVRRRVQGSYKKVGDAFGGELLFDADTIMDD